MFDLQTVALSSHSTRPYEHDATMRYVLFSLSAFVFYAIFYFSYINGLDKLGRDSVASGKLPGTDAPLRTVYTGVEAIDHVVTLLTTFFYPAHRLSPRSSSSEYESPAVATRLTGCQWQSHTMVSTTACTMPTLSRFVSDVLPYDFTRVFPLPGDLC